MKKRFTSKLMLAVMILTLVSTSLIGGTLASYTSTSTATGTVAVASFTELTTVDFDLYSTKTDNSLVVSTEVGPGDVGSFKIALDASETAYSYTYTISSENLPANLSFYSDSLYANKITLGSASTAVDVALNGSTGAYTATSAQEVTIYWKWDATVSTGTDDNADNTAEAAGDAAFTVTVDATQKTS